MGEYAKDTLSRPTGVTGEHLIGPRCRILSLQHRAALHQPGDEEPGRFVQPCHPIELQVQGRRVAFQRRSTCPFQAAEVGRLEAADNRHLPSAFIEPPRKFRHAQPLFKFAATSHPLFSDQERIVSARK